MAEQREPFGAFLASMALRLFEWPDVSLGLTLALATGNILAYSRWALMSVTNTGMEEPPWHSQRLRIAISWTLAAIGALGRVSRSGSAGQGMV